MMRTLTRLLAGNRPSSSIRLLVVVIMIMGTLLVSCSMESEPSPESESASGVSPIILIVVDTLRADHLGIYGHRLPTSPVLDEWSKSGRVYENAFATAPWTLPSFGSLYSGRWPMTHRGGFATTTRTSGPVVPGPLAPDVATLAEILSKRGFATIAVLNNPFLDPSFGTDRGFDVFDYVPGDNHEIRRADVVVRRALALIDQVDGRPFFMVVHLFDPHLDYDAPAPHRHVFSGGYQSQFSLPISDLAGIRRGDRRLSGDDRAFISAAYDEEIAFVDQQLGVFQQGLSARGLHERSLVIFTSDHGEELFEHGGFEHGHAMWQELLHVPFVVWGPGVVTGREPGAVSLVDVVPTALEWSGIEIPEGLDGISLWANVTTAEALPPRTLFAEGTLYGPMLYGAVRWPHKVIASQRGEVLGVFHLDLDPEERLNRLASRRREGEELLSRVLERRRAVARGGASEPSGSSPPSEEVLDRLRALGYIR